jgi:hypothetical protein
MRSFFIARTFIDAHQKAQSKVASYFGEGGEVDSPEEHLVVAESKAMCERAQKAVDGMDPILRTKAKQTTLAQILLGKQADMIHTLQHQVLYTIHYAPYTILIDPHPATPGAAQRTGGRHDDGGTALTICTALIATHYVLHIYVATALTMHCTHYVLHRS